MKLPADKPTFFQCEQFHAFATPGHLIITRLLWYSHPNDDDGDEEE